jgi:hypothetical protein
MKLTKFQQRLIDYIQKYQPCKIPQNTKNFELSKKFKKQFGSTLVSQPYLKDLRQLLDNNIIKREGGKGLGKGLGKLSYLYSINPNYKEPGIEEDPLFKALTKFIAGMIVEKTEKYKNIITGLQEQLCKNPLTEKNEMLYVETITNMQKQLNNANY